MESKKSEIVITTTPDVELRFFKLAGLQGVTANEYFETLVGIAEAMTEALEKNPKFYSPLEASKGESAFDLEVSEETALKFHRMAHANNISGTKMFRDMLDAVIPKLKD